MSPWSRKKTGLTCPRLNVFWFSKNDPTDYSKKKRRKGRQKKRREDNIKEWTGMDFSSSTRAPERRARWGMIVAKSSVVSKVMGLNRIYM